MLNPFVTAAILGFKHALDPDHIAATLNMTLSGKVKNLSALKLGASWGVGHALTMLILGLPIILFSAAFPIWIYTVAELLIGCIIVYLGLKLLVQWFKGSFHPHEILRVKDRGEVHQRSHKKAGLMGSLHGIGGSYAATVLMIASFNDPVMASAGLVLFISLSIVSMSITTLLFSLATFHHAMMHVLDRLLIPTFIVLTVVFGFSYVKEALIGLNVL